VLDHNFSTAYSRFWEAIIETSKIHDLLIPRGPWPFFLKNTPNLPFLAQEAQMKFFLNFFALSTIGSCPKLLGEHVQKVSQKLTTRIVRL
jgi:hypothetical protein